MEKLLATHKILPDDLFNQTLDLPQETKMLFVSGIACLLEKETDELIRDFGLRVADRIMSMRK